MNLKKNIYVCAYINIYRERENYQYHIQNSIIQNNHYQYVYKYMYIYIVNYHTVHLRLKQYYKETVLQFLKKRSYLPGFTLTSQSISWVFLPKVFTQVQLSLCRETCGSDQLAYFSHKCFSMIQSQIQCELWQGKELSVQFLKNELDL